MKKKTLHYLHDGNPKAPSTITIKTGLDEPYTVKIRFSDPTDYARFLMFINTFIPNSIKCYTIEEEE